MKRVILIRHAKAEPHSEAVSDADRRLTASGIEKSGIVAARIKDKGITPDYIVSSPAERAIGMAKIFAEIFQFPEENIEVKRLLYNNDNGESFIDFLYGFDDSFNTAMLFGHNPTMTEFAMTLSSKFRESMPKAGVCVISFDSNSWNSIMPGRGLLELFLKSEE